MEPATHEDLWTNFLAYRPDLAARVNTFIAPWTDRVSTLVTNLAYATAMARVHYLRVPVPLPEAADHAGLARYWKAHYNTAAGKGTEKDFLFNWCRHAPQSVEV